jgi:hypothetical protein
MARVRCATCGAEHDLSEMEPRFGWPHAYAEVPPEERERRTKLGADWCRIRDAAGTEWRYFLRALLPMPVRGAAEACSWGVWVEVSADVYGRVSELWDAEGQEREPPFRATLANRAPDYPDTLGLPGTLQLTGLASVPRFTLDPHLDHPLAREQREGVYPERVLEWLAPRLHP